MKNHEKTNLKLIGKNEDDLKVISAYLQDSIISVIDIVFLENNNSLQINLIDLFIKNLL